MTKILRKYKKGDEFTGKELDELWRELPISNDDIGRLLHDMTVIIEINDGNKD